MTTGRNILELATAWRARCGEKWDADSAVLHILNKAGDHFDLDPAEFEEVDAALALLRAVLDDADKRAAAEPEAKDNGPRPWNGADWREETQQVNPMFNAGPPESVAFDIIKCERHGTLRDPNEGPCWACTLERGG